MDVTKEITDVAVLLSGFLSCYAAAATAMVLAAETAVDAATTIACGSFSYCSSAADGEMTADAALAADASNTYILLIRGKGLRQLPGPFYTSWKNFVT